ncbi:MAG: glycosyltransferase family 2 protein [Phycisphaerales bacterium]|nr:glycosyltransferase family 2 protein [Phycisphaerae bacterium]NNM24902.1 glycosyltransferase family 2 protein [Phycisphaerales bacterium]
MTTDPPPHRDRGIVIIPAYNEADSIAAVVDELAAHAPDLDVVVIDDGSTDGTAGRVPPSAVVLRLPFNVGIGGAMQTGYRYAARHGYDLAVQVDGDGQHRPDQIAVLRDRLAQGDVDVVIGSRFLEPGDYTQTVARAAGAQLLGLLLRTLTGQRFTDCTSGFRAVRGPVIEAFAHWYPDDYPEPEAVLLLHRAKFRVTEVAVAMRPRTAGDSSISFRQGLFYVIKVAAALLVDTLRMPWPQRREVSP